MKLAALLLAPLLLAAAPPAEVSPPAEEDGRARFHGLFLNWNTINRQSIDAERQRAQPQGEAAATPAGTGAAGTRALGERVGEVVATGDCSEGERLARAAGDFALVAAVRDYCTVRTPPRQP